MLRCVVAARCLRRELRQRAAVAMLCQPAHRPTALVFIEVADNQRRQRLIERRGERGDLAAAHRWGAEIAGDDVPAITSGRTEVDVEDLKASDRRLQHDLRRGEPALGGQVVDRFDRQLRQDRQPARGRVLLEGHVRVHVGEARAER
jgi:hypothetical protein